MKQKSGILLWVVVLSMLAHAGIARGQGAITIDGVFGDWNGVTSYSDVSGADDYGNPSRTDITEFRVDAKSDGIFLLMAWDDTKFQSETAAAVTIRSGSLLYFRVYVVADGNPATVSPDSLVINSCTDASCDTQINTCIGTGCTGALLGSGTTWTDPFAGRNNPNCNGSNCGSLDTAVELFLPWELTGGSLDSGEITFLQFSSYPAAPSQASKDTLGGYGATCVKVDETFQCFPQKPTAVTLKSGTVSSVQNTGYLAGLLLLALPVIILYAQRRKRSRTIC